MICFCFPPPHLARAAAKVSEKKTGFAGSPQGFNTKKDGERREEIRLVQYGSLRKTIPDSDGSYKADNKTLSKLTSVTEQMSSIEVNKKREQSTILFAPKSVQAKMKTWRSPPMLGRALFNHQYFKWRLGEGVGEGTGLFHTHACRALGYRFMIN